MTQIFANKLVYKDHPLIEYRGKLDSFQSQILEVMLVVKTEEIPGLYQDLEESLEIMRNILAAEVRDQEFKLETIIGLTAAEIRARSHNPQKYFSVKHILPSPDLGKILIKLNSLRSSVREVEIAAVKAFRDEKGIKRPDIIKALNRMSSVFYVMMCKYQAGKYEKEVI
jgi:ethanolamine utilization cobalamin adenosyltransferase